MNTKRLKRQGIFIETYNEKKGITVYTVFRWAVYIVAAAILVTVIVRFISIGDPKEAKIILADEKINSDIENLGKDYFIYKIDVRNPFDLDDAFFVNNVVYLESSRNFQLTLRCKKNRFSAVLLSKLGTVGEPPDAVAPTNYDALLKIYLKVTTKSNDGGDDITEIKEIDKKYVFETGNYEYIRVSFSSVKIDSAKTKVELFLFMKDLNGEAGFSEDDCIAQFNLFDINMPQSKVNINSFKLFNP